MSDVIKNPAHYTQGRVHEPKDVIRDWGLNFNLGNAVKYLARAGRKDDIIQDLKKAQEYIQFEIEAIENERKSKEAQEPKKHVNCRCSIISDTEGVEDVLRWVLEMNGIPEAYDEVIKAAKSMERMLQNEDY